MEVNSSRKCGVEPQKVVNCRHYQPLLLTCSQANSKCMVCISLDLVGTAMSVVMSFGQHVMRSLQSYHLVRTYGWQHFTCYKSTGTQLNWMLLGLESWRDLCILLVWSAFFIKYPKLIAASLMSRLIIIYETKQKGKRTKTSTLHIWNMKTMLTDLISWSQRNTGNAHKSAMNNYKLYRLKIGMKIDRSTGNITFGQWIFKEVTL